VRLRGKLPDYTYGVAPEGAGTLLTLDADVRTRGWWGLLAPVVRAAIRRTDAGQPAALDREMAGR